jgi:hypothetical protein
VNQICIELDWAMTERVQVLMLRHIIKCKREIPRVLIQAAFAVLIFRIETIFGLISFLHCVRGYADTLADRDHYHYISYCSFEAIAIINTLARAHC